MNILEKIVVQKRKEVAEKKSATSIEQLQQKKFFTADTLSLKKFLLDDAKTGIIAEYKRRSPSKGIINATATVEDVTTAYAANGASAISVLTDEVFFGGSLNDLLTATVNEVPLLRKDFIIDEYQLYESKAFGAEVILLIAACLTPAEVKALAKKARALKMEVLLELHDETELQHICDETEIVGINNRSLKTFEVDIERSLKMAAKIPDDKVKVAESGISSVEMIHIFKQHGFRGFLMGENFMKENNPGIAFENFVAALQQ